MDKVSAIIKATPDAKKPGEWAHFAYRVTLHYQGREMVVPFYVGIGWKVVPTCADVLESLCTECAFIDADAGVNDFEHYAADLGLDPDSRQAERDYIAVLAQCVELRALLGADYDTIVAPDVDDTAAFYRRHCA